MCIVLYVNLIWCSSIQGMYDWLTGVFEASMLDWLGVHLLSVYMCILLYVKCIWYNGLICSYGQLMGGWVHLLCIYVHCAICVRPPKFDVAVFKASMLDWPGGVHLLWFMCALSYMWNLFGVAVFKAHVINWLGGPSAFGLYVHCPICETSLV